jgi:hypothetical protein
VRTVKKISVLLLALALSACASTSFEQFTLKAIDTANTLQDTAKTEYGVAVEQERAAVTTCKQAALAAGRGVPTSIGGSIVMTIPDLAGETTAANWPTRKALCESVGAPIPYDPFTLQRIGQSVNALRDAVLGARAAVNLNSDPEALVKVALAIEAMIADFSKASLPAPAGAATLANDIRTQSGKR